MQKCTIFLASVMFTAVSVGITELTGIFLSPSRLLLNFYTSSTCMLLDLCFAVPAYEAITLGYLDLLILSGTCLLYFMLP